MARTFIFNDEVRVQVVGQTYFQGVGNRRVDDLLSADVAQSDVPRPAQSSLPHDGVRSAFGILALRGVGELVQGEVNLLPRLHLDLPRGVGDVATLTGDTPTVRQIARQLPQSHVFLVQTVSR